MSAMPERVWLTDDLQDGSVIGYAYDPLDVGYTIYVPESALLAAEARVREVEAAAKAAEARWNSPDAVLVTTQVLDDLTTLRAERDALVPLARLGLAVLDGGRDLHKAVLASTAHDAAMALVFVDYPVVDGEQIVRFSLDQPTTTQARAILAREET